VLLLGPVGLHLLLTRQISPLRGVAVGVVAAAAALALTVGFDSRLWMWGRLLWPEGDVLWFNTALNKSVEWGTSPWHWYFLSALPRALHGAFLLAPLGAVLDPGARAPMVVALTYVVLYSFLSHKEVRFLFPALPLWNLSAAAGLARVAGPGGKSTAGRLAMAAVAATLATGVAATLASVLASSANYPGGWAMVEMHRLAEAGGSGDFRPGPITVHIDPAAAMSGVSRFGERSQDWAYCKAEGSMAECFQRDDAAKTALLARGFDFLLTERQSVPGYEVAAVEEGFSSLRLAGGTPWTAVFEAMALRAPLEVRRRPGVSVLRNKR
jgi:alpha-1,6-mannosyltransferase